MPCRHAARVLALTALVLFSRPAQAQIDIVLKRPFIDKYKDRATIEATFVVDKAHAHPNPAKSDGDLHIAGRAEEIGLPTMLAPNSPSTLNR